MSEQNGSPSRLMVYGCMLVKWVEYFIALFSSWAEKIPPSATSLIARLAIAPVFWFSGRTKVDGLELRPAIVYQFREDFGLPFPALMASLAALAEHALPILLVLGLGTRFAAAGLIAMTLVIQLVQPAGWPHHILWFALLLHIMARGGGRVALDSLVAGYISSWGKSQARY